MTAKPFDELPYMDAYLRDILRPRVERTIQAVGASLQESVWRQVVKLLAAEQPFGNDETPGMIRTLLEDKLGLRLEVGISSAFADGGAPVSVPEVKVRPAVLPLVNAILSDSRKAR
jgi:hypothetical protein